MKVILLGMGGPITTQVAMTLAEMKEVQLMCIVKPLVVGYTESLVKKVLESLPKFLQEFARNLKIRFVGQLKWHLPDVCQKYNIPVYSFRNINGPEEIRCLEKMNPDLILIANYNQILKTDILDIPKISTLNIHPSMLPLNRGANPIFWMFKNNDSHGGVTIHKVNKGVDTGDIVLQEIIKLSPKESVKSYTLKCGRLASKLVSEIMRAVSIHGQVEGQVQIEKQSTYFHKPVKEDGLVVIQENLELAFRNIRAMMNYLDVYLFVEGRKFVISKIRYSRSHRQNFIGVNKLVFTSNGTSLILKGYFENGKI